MKIWNAIFYFRSVGALAILVFALLGSADIASAASITTVEPSYGLPVGGTLVTITGTDLDGATAVKFGAADAASFSVNSDSSITAISPPGTDTVDVTVTTSGGTSSASDADQFNYGPTVIRVSPRTGSGVGGTPVVITGTNFTAASAVKFGTALASGFTVESDTEITAIAPAFGGGSASVPVTVTTPGGISSSAFSSTILPEFYFSYGPTVTKVEPDEGPAAGGTTVTIHGTGFYGAKGSDEFPFVESVDFGSSKLTCSTSPNPWFDCSPVTFEVDSETEITATAPAGTGAVDVVVWTHGGASPINSADQFTYGPAIADVRPGEGPSTGGTSVTITGSDFTGATAVEFGSAAADSFKVDSGTEITALSPPGTGIVDVTVATPIAKSPLSAADQFSYVPPGHENKANLVQFVRCRPVRRTTLRGVRGQRKKVRVTKQICTSEAIPSSTGSVSGTGGMAARLTRRNALYATGTATVNYRNTRLMLIPLRRIVPGRYKLVLLSQRDERHETLMIR